MTHGPGPVARDRFEIDKLVPGYHQCIVYSTLRGVHCIVYRVIIPSRCIIGLSFIPSNSKVIPLPGQDVPNSKIILLLEHDCRIT